MCVNASYFSGKFLSTPSARRATVQALAHLEQAPISIHALREEGDNPEDARQNLPRTISIHALREEGDSYYDPMLANLGISIHALREEGDNR